MKDSARMSSKTKTKTKKDETSPKLMPKLRFTGFSGSWTYEPLSRFLKEHKLKNTEGRDVFSVSMEYGIVNQIELLGRSYAAAETSHYTIGRRFDVVYTKSPLKAFPFGIVKQCKFDGEVALSPLYGVFTPPNPHLGLMIEAYFESPNRSKDFLSPLCQKGAKNTLQITNTTFLSGRMPLPTEPAEQQKIASCLSSLDTLITAHTQKLNALKTYKKGLMQQLFPREGETQPRLRFPEFQNAGEWETKPFEEFVTKSFYGTSSSTSPAGKYPVLRMGNMVDGGLDFKNLVYLDLDAESFESFRLENGDILLNRTNSPALVGKISLFQLNSECMTASYIVSYRLNKKRIDPSFCNSMLNTPLYQSRIRSFAKPSVSQVNINPTTFKKDLMVSVPSLPEQQRIAECLTSIDDLIAVQTQKLEALRTHKKGLLQQIFPSPEE
jgi:type I restriction enzyme S subunit